jgi:hypothetical protein
MCLSRETALWRTFRFLISTSLIFTNDDFPSLNSACQPTEKRSKKLQATLNSDCQNNIRFSHNELCVYCGENCRRGDSINCYLCEEYFHRLCCGLKPADYSKVKDVLAVLGWTCTQRRCDVRRLLQSDRAALSTVHPDPEIDRVESQVSSVASVALALQRAGSVSFSA